MTAGLTRDALTRIERRVEAYMDQFAAGVVDPAPYILKHAHTKRVCTHIVMLARSLAFSPEALNLCAATALLHDLGRFPQFQRYGTFSDPQSLNHAALSVGEIRRIGLLEGLPRATRQLVYRTVALHNRPTLPAGLPRELDCHARLLRDADKLDIFKVMTDVYGGPGNGQASFITHNYCDDGRVNPELIEQVAGLGSVPYSRIRSLNDLKLFQLSMIFDLNFPAACNHVLEQAVVQGIIGSMPETEALGKLEQILIRYLAERAAH